MTLVEIQPRSVIGAPTPPASRTKLPVPCKHLLVHYCGAGTYGNGARSELAEAKAIATYGINAGKPYEYNYMGGWQGGVYEQAGEFMGQHCLNFNSKSMGYLFILGVGVAPTQAAVESFRKFRADMVAAGRLAPDHECVPHYRYRATSCCAQLAAPRGAKWASPTGEGYLGDLIPSVLAPWIVVAPPAPQPIPKVEEDVPTARFVQKKGKTAWWRVGDIGRTWQVEDPNSQYVQQRLRELGITEFRIHITEDWVNLDNAYGPDLTPVGFTFGDLVAPIGDV